MRPPLPSLLLLSACGVVVYEQPADTYDSTQTADGCGPATPGMHVVTGTDASPYLLHNPPTVGDDIPIVVYLPGGAGNLAHAQATFDALLAGADGLDSVRIALPFAPDGYAFSPTYGIAEGVSHEVLRCAGGSWESLHLAGHDVGGDWAFRLAVQTPYNWASLLGAPALWGSVHDGELLRLDGTPVLHAVGELDVNYRDLAEAQHTRMIGLGLDSTLVLLEGQDRKPAPGWTGKDFQFDFWLQGENP